MPEPEKAQESLMIEELAKPEGEAPNVNELLKQVQNLQNSLKAEQDRRKTLEEKAKEHGAEMVRKKEREREALEKEKKALEEKGEYAKAMEILKTQLDEAKQYKTEAETIRKEAELERKRYKVTMLLNGQIDPKVPVKHAVALVDLDAIKFDEKGEIADSEAFLNDFFTKEEWLKPPAGSKIGAPPPPGGSGAATSMTKEMDLVVKGYGLDPDVVKRMDEKSIKGLLLNMPPPEPDNKHLFQ